MPKDRRFDYKNNQKKTLSAYASGVISAAAGALSDTLFTLPVGSLVQEVKVIVIKKSATPADAVKVLVGAVELTPTASVVGVDGVVNTAVNKYFATGGKVSLTGTLVGTAEFKVVVTYLETELTTGTYTD